MKKILSIIALIASTISPIFAQIQEPLVNLEAKRTADNISSIELGTNTIIIGTETEITPTSLSYRYLKASLDEGFEFKLPSVPTGSFTVGIKTLDNKELAFKFTGTGTAATTTIQILDNGVSVLSSPVTYSTTQIIYRVEREGNSLYFSMNSTTNSTLLFTKDYTGTLSDVSIELKSVDAGIFLANVFDLKKILGRPDNTPATNGQEGKVYVSLKKQLDGSCVSLLTEPPAPDPNNPTPAALNTIRIKFDEDYNASADKASYEIYNWKREKKQSGILSLVNKTNWIAIAQGSLTVGEPYTLEVTTNKGEKYYLRFK